MSHSMVVVGYGTMGVTHAKKLAAIDGVTVAGVVDIDPSRLDIALADGLKVYADLDEALADLAADFVFIATPNDSHHPIAMAALGAGKNVLCEKPVMLNSAELEDVIAESARVGKLFMVHQNRRWDPDYLVMKKIYDEQIIGPINYIETRVHGSRGIPSDWRHEKAFGGGMVFDWGVHLMDRLLLIVDSPITDVYARLSFVLGNDVDDGMKAYLTFANGIHALVDVSTTSFVPQPKWFMSSNIGTAVVEDWDMNGKIVRLATIDEADAVPIEAGAGMTKTMAPRVDDSTDIQPLPTVEGDIADFYRNALAVADGTAAPLITDAQVLRVMRLMEAVFESDRTGEVVHFEPSDR